MKTTLFTAGLLSVLLTYTMSDVYAKSPLDVFDLPEAERNMTVTYCERTRHYPASHEAMYPSELLKISEEDEPLYAYLAGDRTVPYANFVRKFGSLLDEKDECDRVGIVYLAKIFVHFWPGTAAYEKLDKNMAESITQFLVYPDPFFQKIRIEARNMVADRYPQD